LQPQPKPAPVSQTFSSTESDSPSLIASPMVNRPSQIANPKSDSGSQTKPPLPAGIKEYFLPQNYSLPEAFQAAQKTMPAQAMIEGVIYKPTLIASAQVRVIDRKLGVDSEVARAALVMIPEKRGSVSWDDYTFNSQAFENVDTSPAPSARFGSVDAPLNDTKLMTALQKDFTDWALRNSSVKARTNTALKVSAGPDVSRAEFMRACAEAASDARDKDIAKQTAQYDRQLKTLEDKLAREERELQMDQNELAGRKREENSNLFEIGASALGIGRKKSLTSQFAKNRLTNKAKADVEESIDAIAQYKQQVIHLQKQRDELVAELNDRWGHLVNDIEEVTVTAKKTDIFVNLFGVAWMPYYTVQAGGAVIEIPAFGAE
ncbi:MAG: hypothetical protein ABI986_11960, partial [Chloroflexota bacterium]